MMVPLQPCPRCTQLLPLSASFCRRCGVAIAAPRQEGAAVAATEMFKPSAKVRRWPWVLVLLGVVGGVLVIAGLYRGAVAPSSTVTDNPADTTDRAGVAGTTGAVPDRQSVNPQGASPDSPDLHIMIPPDVRVVVPNVPFGYRAGPQSDRNNLNWQNQQERGNGHEHFHR